MEKKAGREREGVCHPLTVCLWKNVMNLFSFCKMGTLEVLNRYLISFPIASTKYPTPKVMLLIASWFGDHEVKRIVMICA